MHVDMIVIDERYTFLFKHLALHCRSAERVASAKAAVFEHHAMARNALYLGTGVGVRVKRIPNIAC